MLVDIKNMPGEARLWVHMSKKPLDESLVEAMAPTIEEFLSHWKYHDKPIRCGYRFELGHFLLIAVDESFRAIGGCGIDTSIRLVKELNLAYQTDFLDRLNVPLMMDGVARVFSYSKVGDLLEEGVVDGQTMTFDTTLTSLKDWEERGLQPLECSWLRDLLETSSQKQVC